VALKTGRSAIGETLTLSHTGSLAGSGALYEALFARLGIIAVSNPSQLLETLKLLCVAGPPEGPEVLGFTCSGGGATMLADRAEAIGLGFPAPDAGARAALEALLPAVASVTNPLDYSTPIWGQPERTGPVFAEAMARIPAQATLLVQDYPAPGLDETEALYLADGMAFAEAARAAGLPAAICAILPENIGPHIRETFIARGVAPMQGVHEALGALQGAAWWQAARARILRAPPGALVAPAPAPGADGSLRLLSEAEGKARLARAGVAVPEGRAARAAHLVERANEIGFPVALKMMGAGLAHKTEAGAVALGLGSPAELLQAAEEMRARVACRAPGAVSEDFLVERMAPPPLAELVVGIRRDPQFGLAMTLGSGGILVELVGDTAALLLPAGPEEISAALDGLRVARLLNGFRGQPAADRAALVAALSGLAGYAAEHAGEIAEIEINPLFVYRDGVLAVDVLMQVDAP